jgi:hypothetical protein
MASPQYLPKSKGEQMKTCPQCSACYPGTHITCLTHGVLLNEIREFSHESLSKGGL